MQTEHPAVGLPASVLADAVRRRSFSGSVRGFDRNEVREYLSQVAAELEQISQRQEALEVDLREARGRASNPVLDEATITAALGQEAARILQSAHEAAADVRRRAEENAATVLREAHESAERVAADSENLLATRTTEAEAMANGITEAASAEAEAAVARARAEAEATVADAVARAEAMIADASARAEATIAEANAQAEATVADAEARARSMVADAERGRDQVLSELMRRRRVVYAQVEQLGAGRDALLTAVASVKTLIGDAEAALEAAEANAKTAADSALRRSMNGPQPPVEEVLAEAEAAAPPAESVQSRRPSRSRRAQPVKAEEPEAPVEIAPALYDIEQEAAEEQAPEPVEAESQVAEAAEAEAVEVEVEAVEVEAEAPAPAEAEEPPATQPQASTGAAGRRSPRRTPVVAGDPLPDDAVEGVRIIGPVSAANTPKAEADQPPTVVAAESAGAEKATDSGPQTGRPTTTSVGAETAGDAGAPRTAAKRPRKQAVAKAETVEEQSAPARPEAGDGVSADAEEASAEVAEDKATAAKAAGEPAAVDALFARLKADRVEATKRAEQVLADASQEADGEVEAQTETKAGARRPRKTKAAEPESAEIQPGGAGAGGEAEDGDDAALARRSGLLDPVYDKLTRRLKRTLQDDQNDVLDRMRAGARTADALLAEADDHARRYSGVAAAHLAEAWAAGLAYATDEFHGALSAEPDDGREAAARLAEEIVVPLRRRIEEAVATAGSDEASLADAVGAAYRSLKGDRVSQLAVDHVTAAFADGVLASVPQGTPVRWVVDDDGPCPDCDDNALAGATPAGEEFPTGQVHPPAHSGCRCLLVAAVS